MDIFDEEFIKFWKALSDNHVRYIMIGGVATNLHGYQRTTDYIDVWIEDTKQNRANVRAAFRDYGIGDIPMMETLQIVPGWTNFHLNNSIRLDLMVNVKGLENYSFEECLKLASIAEIENVSVPFLHINQLIESKKAANRPKDQVDVIYLEKIKKLSEEQ